jgi:hypothetical protein
LGFDLNARSITPVMNRMRQSKHSVDERGFC